MSQRGSLLIGRREQETIEITTTAPARVTVELNQLHGNRARIRVLADKQTVHVRRGELPPFTAPATPAA